MKSLRQRLISLILSVIMIVCAGIPAFAAEEADTGNAVNEVSVSTEVAAKKVVTAKRLKISSIDITFKNAVVSGEFLGSDTYTNTLKTVAYKKSIKLTWSSVKNKSGIDGYIIVRKDKKGSRWREIAKVSRNATSYTDKAAKTKNVFYKYSLLAYKKTDNGIMVSKAANWAGALTTKSKKKNVTSVTVDNLASTSAIMLGKGVRTELTFPKKAYSKYIRWSSSNSKVASVNKEGLIIANAVGNAVIYAKTHTGNVIKIPVVVFEGRTAESMITVMQSWMGYSYANKKHRSIVDIYNSMYPLPVGYRMKYYDAWCDCTVSAAAIQTGNVDVVGRECGVSRHIKIFKSLGIWIEGNSTVPEPGDLIVFNWTPVLKNNASHIGIVQKVEGNMITTIEGNMGTGKVGTRTIPVGWKYVRGYARPEYKGGVLEEEELQDAE